MFKIQTQPNRWSCLPTAFGILTGVNVKFIIKWLGHDGSEIVRPELEDPFNRRSFHIQEMADWALDRGLALTGFEPNPVSVAKEKPYFVQFPIGNQNRMMLLLKRFNGVLTGQSIATGSPHAVAWNSAKGKIYNPNGEIQDLDAFAISTFWTLHRIES